MSLQIHICKTTNKKNKFRINKTFSILKNLLLQNKNKSQFLNLKKKCEKLENEIEELKKVKKNEVKGNLDDVAISYIQFLENSKNK